MAEKAPESDKSISVGKAATVVLGLYITTSISCLGAMFVSLQNIQIQLASIEANRFTIADGYILREQISDTEKAIGRLPDAFPPTWFMDDYKIKTQEILEFRKRINSLEKEVLKCK